MRGVGGRRHGPHPAHVRRLSGHACATSRPCGHVLCGVGGLAGCALHCAAASGRRPHGAPTSRAGPRRAQERADVRWDGALAIQRRLGGVDLRSRAAWWVSAMWPRRPARGIELPRSHAVVRAFLRPCGQANLQCIGSSPGRQRCVQPAVRGVVSRRKDDRNRRPSPQARAQEVVPGNGHLALGTCVNPGHPPTADWAFRRLSASCLMPSSAYDVAFLNCVRKCLISETGGAAARMRTRRGPFSISGRLRSFGAHREDDRLHVLERCGSILTFFSSCVQPGSASAQRPRGKVLVFFAQGDHEVGQVERPAPITSF